MIPGVQNMVYCTPNLLSSLISSLEVMRRACSSHHTNVGCSHRLLLRKISTDIMKKSPLEKTAVLISVILPLAGTALAIWLLWQRLVTWRDIAIMFGMYFFTVLGITVGFH